MWFVWAAAAAELVITGDCPGSLTVTVGGTPGAEVALLTSAAPGLTPVPAGPCAGTPLDLDADGLALRVRATDDDGDGRVRLTPTLGEGPCGLPVQALDLATCETSAVVPLPSVPVEPDEPFLIAAAGQRAGDGLWRIEPATGVVRFVGAPGHGYTSLAYDRDGVLHGLTARTDADTLQIHALDDDAVAALVVEDVAALSEAGLAHESGLGWNPAEGRWWLVDQDGQVLTLTEDFEPRLDRAHGSFGEAFGRDVAVNVGGRVWFVNHAELWTVTADGATLQAHVTGIPHAGDRNGGAATWHAGALWIAESDGVDTWLFTVDTLTGVATDTGLRIPDPAIDALTSPSP